MNAQDIFGKSAEPFIKWLSENCDRCAENYCGDYNSLLESYGRNKSVSEPTVARVGLKKTGKQARCKKFVSKQESEIKKGGET